MYVQCTTETKSMAALGKVIQPQLSSHRLSLLDLQIAGLQGCANTLGPKSGWRGRESNQGLLLTWQRLYTLVRKVDGIEPYNYDYECSETCK